MSKFFKKFGKCMLIACASLTSTAVFAEYPAGSPVAINGKLQVKGTQLVNECGYPVQLRGMSSHGLQWTGNCICESSLRTLVNDWGISVFRIALYVQENGYVTDKDSYKKRVDEIINYCEDLGIYCLIDWHVLTPSNPNNSQYSDAPDFWDYISKKHGSKKHVLYEICNEPNSYTEPTSWSDVKSYAERMLKIIRTDNQDNTIVIVGTTTWSQDVDIASKNPLNGNNIMYTLHFYAGDHGDWLKQKANTALSNGAALFITEFGSSKADGNGGVYENDTRNWIKWANEKNISYINWSFSGADETSAALKVGSCNEGKWNNTSTSGTLIKELLKADPKSFTACNGQQQGGQQQGGQQQGGQQQGGQQQGGQQQTQPVTYPDLTTNIIAGQGYRIVNKATGKVMSSNNKMEGDAPLVTVTRKEGDNSQIYIFKGVDQFFRLRNDGSGKYLTNKYQPNDGTDIVQIDYNQWDESEKWKITLVDGNWFRIENNSVNNNNTCIYATGNNDGDAVKQITWSKQDNQLWGLEKTDVDDSGVASFSAETFVFYPTVWGDEFFIEGYGFDQVEVCGISGVTLRQFEKADSYNVSTLSSGTYFVLLKSGNDIVGRFRAIKK